MSYAHAPAVERRPRGARSGPTPNRVQHGKLLEKVTLLHERLSGDPPAFRRAAIETLQAALALGRDEARRALEGGGTGRACAEALSAQTDDLLRVGLEMSDRWLAAVEPGQALPTIVAVGGYGRGMLAPFSDIDLLFLLPNKPPPGVEKVVESLLYVLWDLKQKVGHATRTVDECLKQARADMTIRTTLVEARFVIGDKDLFETLQKRFDAEIVAKTAPEFVAAKLAEREARVRRAGASRYLVEPNVKEGKGGLRDLNTLFWISKYVYRVRNAHDLIAAGVFSPRELALFRRCEEFLWTVRCRLHFLAGRAEERLSFDVQRPIARQLGYSTRAGLIDVERFMKHYFLIAKDVGDLTAIVCAALEERQTKRTPAFGRLIGRLRRRTRAIAEARDFKVENDRVNVIGDDAFERDPVNLIRLFWIADRSNLPIHPNATRLVTQSLKRIDARLRDDAEANRLFLEILTSRNAPEITLRRMNEAGVLGRFIPDFGRVVGMMQFSMYHHYTVDEHLIRAVGELSAIEAGRLVEDLPLSTKIMPQIAHRIELYLATFLHDIAKGRGVDHSLAGAEVARKLGPRLGLSPGNTERVAWLIEQHLVMSNTAQGRDLLDPRTAEALSAIVQTQERLKMLLMLTVADIRAVGPGVWNGWKGQLLRTLYWETEVVLGGGHSVIDRKGRIEAAQEKLRRLLAGWSDPEFDTYIQRHYPAYWLKVEPARQAAHAKLLHAMAAETRSLATEVTTDAFHGVTAVTVVAPDHPRLLTGIAGACAAAGGNIVDAQIFTTTDGLALDTIFVSRAFERDDDELRRGQRIAANIEKTLRGEVRLAEISAPRQPRDVRRGAFAIEPEVTVDNNLSRRYTVVEVSGLDRPGLLRDLTASLSSLNLNIGSAHIVTFGEKAVDSFYVADLTGQKINAPARQAAIKRRLLADFATD
ncbi:MAG TPA: [protein-PII] uridylyltransferase [Roseiarcus sp.]|jgi:[protein-PII] uridylyltransferase